MIFGVKIEEEKNNVKFYEHKLQKQTERNTFGWSKEENLRYAHFLKENLPLFKTQKKRRSLKVYKLISETVKSRTLIQCKSHHQKMLLKYGGNHRIIKKILGQEVFVKQEPEENSYSMLDIKSQLTQSSMKQYQ